MSGDGTTSVEAVLTDLAGKAATGCLSVRDEQGAQAELYLREGQVYAVTVPGRRPRLGARLTTSGALDPARLAEALEVQRTELQGWRLGELLVHLGHVDRAIVEAYVVEQLEDAVTDLLGWPVVAWRFRANRRTRQDVAPPSDVAELLAHARSRRVEWATVLAETGGALGVPELVDREDSADADPLDPAAWALLSRVDGRRTIGMLATACGLTLFEAGQVVRQLLAQHLVTVRQPVAVPDDPVPDDPEPAGAAAAAPASAAVPVAAPPATVPATVPATGPATVPATGPPTAPAITAPAPPAPAAPTAADDEEDRRRREAEEIAALLQARAEADAAARRARRLAARAAAEAELGSTDGGRIEPAPVVPTQPAGPAHDLEPAYDLPGELDPLDVDPLDLERERREAADRERQLALAVLTAVPRMRPPAPEPTPTAPAASRADLPLDDSRGEPGAGFQAVDDLAPPPAAVPEPSPAVTDGWAPAVGLADTAALLRELSNLGVDAADRPLLPAASARPTATAPLAERRRRRLFGH